jgi:hypothetical protein
MEMEMEMKTISFTCPFKMNERSQHKCHNLEGLLGGKMIMGFT